jgi:hypothetical protein
MEMNGQLNAPTALLSGKVLPVRIGYGTKIRSEHCRVEKIFPLSESKLWTPSL